MSKKLGHALLVGINDFSQHTRGVNDLNATPDVDYWRTLLKYNYYYKNIMELRNEQATLQNVILSFFKLASTAEEEDIVTMAFLIEIQPQMDTLLCYIMIKNI